MTGRVAQWFRRSGHCRSTSANRDIKPTSRDTLPRWTGNLSLCQFPVTDVDRAKAFYVNQVGFNADHDHQVNDTLRFVQLTPPGSGMLGGARNWHHRYGTRISARCAGRRRRRRGRPTAPHSQRRCGECRWTFNRGALSSLSVIPTAIPGRCSNCRRDSRARWPHPGDKGNTRSLVPCQATFASFVTCRPVIAVPTVRPLACVPPGHRQSPPRAGRCRRQRRTGRSRPRGRCRRLPPGRPGPKVGGRRWTGPSREFRQTPPVLDAELVTPGRLEPGLGQHLGIGPPPLRLGPVDGDPVLRAECGLPPIEQRRVHMLPLLGPRGGRQLRAVRPAQRHKPCGPKPMQQPGGDQFAVEPVEGAADDGQLEVPGCGGEGLGVRRDRAYVPSPQIVDLGLDHLHEAEFPVNGPDFREGSRRRGKASWPVPQAKSSSRPCPET